MTAGVDPAVNARTVADAVREAAAGGASFLSTPEMSNLLDQDRARATANVRAEGDDPVLAAVRDAARAAGIWVHLGSIAVAIGDSRRANRAILIGPDGSIRARYDKIHLFDADLPNGERWRESAAYVAGGQAVLAETPLGRTGFSICYDLRFPALYSALAEAGATALLVPAAFTVATGEAHWHVMLRARAIESMAFVLAAAQTGTHEDGRRTYGHSLVIDPWGTVLLDMGTEPGVGIVRIDPARVAEVRERLPALGHRRAIPVGGACLAPAGRDA